MTVLADLHEKSTTSTTKNQIHVDNLIVHTYNLLRASGFGKAHTVELAQLVRALVCGTRGRGFDPHIPPHFSFIVGERIP